MIKVLSVIGTRPEAIKMGPVIRALGERRETFQSSVCVTGQHRQMLDQVLNLFRIAPDHDLDLMTPGQTLARLTASVIEGMDRILQVERPDWVLVQGDTTTVLASALAAAYRQVKVGHVEAGLRTYEKHHPFPEEINRRVASVVADLHFAPTSRAAENLLREGVPPDTVRVTGNTVIDAIQWVASVDPEPSGILCAGEGQDLPAKEKRIILVTAHRRESFGRGLEQVCEALRTIVASHPNVQVVYPVHPNPNVQEPVYRLLNGVSGITLLPPLDYLAFVRLIRLSHFVITDSGGLQEEAPGLGKPVLVLRETTERPEGIDAGTVRLVGTDRAKIVAEASRLLTDPAAYTAMARSINPYGDGHAAARIVAALCDKQG
ncbi:non-hydrolyzing UDP-N-acetylglucosamine 2-epimerase [Singulisphaera acidiphila]|uniref:UDP-N-acetylglucosamine 2-epimerase (non-hydrolyzing) n=1 Tax=Singulisphaera acidiphila (strain ATCC BAA-1392 / DSM 18658 / VKM B-2454 / MOB10) TaxID=886293 RepID=L0DH13_SINAD|nr:UDP-N-acetylglucosamine 2-epimerase (non-hydrolyzing) [Singulisphaera acidiphila]AGA28108.1 UDP-N-acetylglucosamine 2-epimerase [Singulisphaera acidiphila DSM 18658]